MGPDIRRRGGFHPGWARGPPTAGNLLAAATNIVTLGHIKTTVTKHWLEERNLAP